jgi:hypothetical protein
MLLGVVLRSMFLHSASSISVPESAMLVLLKVLFKALRIGTVSQKYRLHIQFPEQSGKQNHKDIIAS